MLPEGDCHLVLLRDGQAVHRANVASTGDSGVLDWSADGSEILFVETEQDEFGQPAAWDVRLSGVQSDSVPVTLFHTEDVILAPMFTKSGDITYLWLQDDDDLPKLTLYDRAEGTNRILRDDVVSYRRVTWDGDLAIVSETIEGELKMAHISSYNIVTGDVEEVASFFLSQGMEETLFILPATFLWDIEPTDRYVAFAIYDQALIAPQVDNSSDQPALYLINPDEESAHRVSDIGIMPAFSPNGYLLSYIGATQEDSDIPVIYLYDPDTQESRPLENTIGVSSLFWIDDETLGFTVNGEKEDTYKMMKVSPDTGDVAPLLSEIQ